MAIIQKIFAYNTGAPIFGTTQVGDIAVSNIDVEYSDNYGGVQWWGGPDETNGYVIAHTDPSGSHDGGAGGPAFLGFWRSSVLTDQSFLDLCNSIPPRIGDTPFTTTSQASSWLTANGYWTSFTTSGGTGDFNVTISQVGPNVVWNGSGSFNTTSLISNGTSNITAGSANSQAIWAVGSGTYPGDAVDIYSGVTTFVNSFGTDASPTGALLGSGSTFGILPNGINRDLYVPTGYVSGSFISGSTTYQTATIAGLGYIPGTYTWSWGSGGSASSLVMTINS